MLDFSLFFIFVDDPVNLCIQSPKKNQLKQVKTNIHGNKQKLDPKSFIFFLYKLEKEKKIEHI